MAYPTEDRDPRQVPPIPYVPPPPPPTNKVPPPAQPKPPPPPAPSGGGYYPSPYGGGGGGGGGYSPPAPDPNQFAGLPSQYVMGLRQFVGDPSAYYTPRGAEKQAQQDFYSMSNAWLNRANVPLTPDDWGDVWGTLNAYRQGYTTPGAQQTWTFADALNYLGRMLSSAPQAPQVAYLRTGEI
jgi:hypothetical protein